MNKPIVLSLQNISVQFGGLRALNDVSLDIVKGDRYGILGPNGAGKTTLYNAITGYVPTITGRVILEGQEIGALPTY